MAKAARRPERIDPTWPGETADGHHPVSELASHTQGAQSPFGEITFPAEDVHYEHPVTVINK
ncbi:MULTISPECIES: hypothetical protein [Allokutzneria]|uniref:Uncharacterized protein n=1 Tax=Allokutzneria albata TaxID=211114 RepID=A0A1H0AWA0_ALLAB|nr:MULTISPECIES: hypothetical protein [Allokutzneria]MCP3800087.1 hypothetical protein [Allokutzneria sp. A3M-2-11 16]SDN37740.1 hypothetical protein SAMN04489726_6318 [Allokutzneria albata]